MKGEGPTKRRTSLLRGSFSYRLNDGNKPNVGPRRFSSVYFSSTPANGESSFSFSWVSKVVSWGTAGREERKRKRMIASRLDSLHGINSSSASSGVSSSYASLRERSKSIVKPSSRVVPSNIVHSEHGLEEKKPIPFTIEHGTKAWVGVELGFFVMFLLNILFVPVILFFPYSTEEGSSSRGMLLSMTQYLDLVIWVYVYLSMFHLVRHAREHVHGRADIFLSYVFSRWFVVHVLCAIPLVATGIINHDHTLRTIGCLLRFLLIFQVQRSRSQLIEYLNQTYFVSQDNVFRMVSLMSQILLLAYFLAGAYHWVSFHALRESKEPNRLHVVNESTFEFTNTSLTEDLVTSIYFTIQTLYTVGYGDFTPSSMEQMQFVLLCIFCGTIVHALVIAHMTSVLKNMDVTAAHFKQKMATIQLYLHERKIKSDTQTKVLDYFNFIWARQRGKLEVKILSDLPITLRTKICRVKRATLLNLPFFQGRDLAFLDALVAGLEPQILNFPDFLCLRGDPVEALWFLSEGRLEVLSAGVGDGTGEFERQTTNKGNSNQSTGGSLFYSMQRRFKRRQGAGSKIFDNLRRRASSVLGLRRVENQEALIVETIVPGEKGFYGEEILFSENQVHHYSVRAAKICELQRLDLDLFKLILQIYSRKNNAKQVRPKPVLEKQATTAIDDGASTNGSSTVTGKSTIYRHFPSRPSVMVSAEQKKLQLRGSTVRKSRGSSVSSTEMILDSEEAASLVPAQHALAPELALGASNRPSVLGTPKAGGKLAPSESLRKLKLTEGPSGKSLQQQGQQDETSSPGDGGGGPRRVDSFSRMEVRRGAVDLADTISIIPTIPEYCSIDVLPSLDQYRIITSDPATLASIQKWIDRVTRRESHLNNGTAINGRPSFRRMLSQGKLLSRGDSNAKNSKPTSLEDENLEESSKPRPSLMHRVGSKISRASSKATEVQKPRFVRANIAVVVVNHLFQNVVDTLSSNSKTRFLWEFLLLLSHIYMVIIPPLGIAIYSYDPENAVLDYSWISDLVFDMIIFLSVFLTRRYANDTTSAMKRLTATEILEDRGKVNLMYYFLLAICAIFSTTFRLQQDTNTSLWFRFPFITLIYPLITKEVFRFGSHFDYFASMGTIQHVAIQITMAVITNIHWSTCLWISFDEYQRGKSTDLSDAYLRSLYWSLVTVTTVGFGDIVPKTIHTKLLSIFVMIVGATIYAGFVSILAAITRNTEDTTHSLEHFDDCCRHYLRHKQLPGKLVGDCLAYLEYAAANHTRIEEESILEGIFPKSLQELIKRELLGERFCHQSPLFKGLPENFFSHVIRQMRKEIFPPGYCITSGYNSQVTSKSTDMYDRGLTRGMVYLEVGSAEILSPMDKAIGKVTAGKSFAWISMFEPEKQELKLRALEYCEVWYLSGSGLSQALNLFDPTQLSTAEAAALVSGENSINSFEEIESLTKSEMTEKVRETLLARAREVSKGTGNIAKNLKNAKLNKLMMTNESDNEGNKVTERVFAPESKIQQRWHVFILVCCVYNIIVASYRLGLTSGTLAGQPIFLFVFDYIADFAYAIDIVLRFRYFATEYNGVIESKRSTIKQIYLKTRDFHWDVLSTLPVSVIVSLAIGFSNMSTNIHAGLRFITFLRAYRLGFWVNIVKGLVPLQENITTFISLLCFILMFAHVGGCLFFGIARINVFEDAEYSWVVKNSDYPLLVVDVNNETTYLLEENLPYQRSLYWAVAALTTVGYGDYHPVATTEIIYTVFLLMMGGFMYALILNNLEEIIAHSDISSILFQRKLDDFNSYTKYRALPKDLTRKITAYYNLQWLKQKGVEETWIQDRLPLPLRRWVRAELLGQRATKNFPFFHSWDMLEELLDLIRPATFPEDTMLFLHEELIYKCYFVTSGVVEYVAKDGSQVFTSFRQGDVFAQIQFLFNEPTECIARASEVTDVFVLHRVDFDVFLRAHPELAERFKKELPEIESDLRKKCSLDAFTRNLGKAKVNKLFMMEAETQNKGFCNGESLIPVNNLGRRIWDIIVLLCGVYLFVSIPYRMAFLRKDVTSKTYLLSAYDHIPYLATDVVVDLILIIDAVLRASMFTAIARKRDGVTLWTRKEVRMEYLRSSFLFDVLMLLPIDYLLQAGAIPQISEHATFVIIGYGLSPAAIALFRAQRMLIGFRILGLFNSLISFIEERGVVMTSGYRQISRMGFVFFLAVHLVACMKCALSYRYLDLLRDTENTATVDDDGIFPGDAYLLCLYWAFYTTSTVGYGNIQVDSPLFAVFCMVFGAFLCDAGVTATLSNILSNQDSKISDAKRKRVSLVQYMKTHHINHRVTRQVLQFVDHKYRALGSLDEHEILGESCLPSHFRIEISAFVLSRSVPEYTNHPLFAGLSPGLLQTMALMLEPAIFPTGHIILCENSKAEMKLSRDASSSRLMNEQGDDNSFKSGASGSNKYGSSSFSKGVSPLESLNETSLEFLRTANLGDPGLSLYHSSFANIGWRRYKTADDGDQIYILVSGSVIVTKGTQRKVIRRGLISKSSGIDAAKTISHSECFVLDISQYSVLAQFSSTIGNVYSSFQEVLEDKEGFKAVEQFLMDEKNGNWISDLYFWKDCCIYESKPKSKSAQRIYRRYFVETCPDGFESNTSNNTFLDFGPEMKKSVLSRLNSGEPDVFLQAKEMIYQRLEQVVKPRFLASNIFPKLLSKKSLGEADPKANQLHRQTGYAIGAETEEDDDDVEEEEVLARRIPILKNNSSVRPISTQVVPEEREMEEGTSNHSLNEQEEDHDDDDGDEDELGDLAGGLRFKEMDHEPVAKLSATPVDIFPVLQQLKPEDRIRSSVFEK